MTVPIETSRVNYVGNGVTQFFSTVFYFLDPLHVTVRTTIGGVTTLRTQGVEYGIIMPPSPGSAGQVVFIDGYEPDPGMIIVIERDVSIVQPVSFRTNGNYSPKVYEDTFDLVVMEIQEQARDIKDLQTANAPGNLVAGNGVTLTAGVLAVGAGSGVLVGADDVGLDWGTAPSITPVVSDNGSTSAGVLAKAARIDHRHQAVTAAPAAVVIGASASKGSSGALAAADHIHPVSSGTPVSVDKSANAEGNSTAFARLNHKHDVTTATAIELTDTTNAEGASTELARATHTHAHGNRGGGTLHADATTSTSGFMSAADKTKLAAAVSAYETVTDATVVTTAVAATQIMSWRPADNTTEFVELTVVGKQQSGAKAAGYKRRFTTYRSAGTTVLVGTDSLNQETDAAWDVTVSVVSPDVFISVIGADAVTITWNGTARRTKVVGV